MARSLRFVLDSLRELLLPDGSRIVYNDERESVVLIGDAMDPCGYDVYIADKRDVRVARQILSEEGASKAAEYIERKGKYVGSIDFCVFIRGL